jgi:lysophospholipase L1-like esterase
MWLLSDRNDMSSTRLDGRVAAFAGRVRLLLVTALSVGALLAALVPLAPARAATVRWLTSWGPAMAAAQPNDPHLTAAFPSGRASDQSLRMLVRVTAPGTQLRLRLSNRFGALPLGFGAVTVARQAAGPVIQPGSTRAVRFAGRPSVSVPAGAEVTSDPLAFSLAAGDIVAVSLDVTTTTRTFTWHSWANTTAYVTDPGSGDQTGDEVGTHYQRSAVSGFWLAGIEQASPYRGTVVALGDSITDGYPVLSDQHQPWPDVLASRMASAPPDQQFAVVNAGIVKNELLHTCLDCGPAALERLDHDVLDVPGAADVVVFEGTNDLAQDATAAQVIGALDEIAVRAHHRGMRVLGATLTPRADAGWTARMEANRETVNRWVRTSGAFDHVVDFDVAVRDPALPSTLLPVFDSGDHLHPNAAGLKQLGDAIDLGSLA